VQSYALEDGNLARQALQDYGQHLTDTDHASLTGLITTMEAARQADATAQVGETARRAALSSDLLAHSRLSQLANPATGDVQMPDNWLRDTVADPRVDPATKAALWQAHENLSSGDIAASDPNLVAHFIGRLAGDGGARPTLAEVVSHAGDDLTLADAQHLAAATFPQTPANRAYLGQVAQTLDSARSIIASPENGAAGQRAFGRFTDWFMQEARGGAVMDPRSPDWVLADPHALARFMPTGDDLLGAFNNRIPNWNQRLMRQGENPEAGAPSLTPGQDTVIGTPRAQPANMPRIIDSTSIPGNEGGVGIPPGGWNARPPRPSLGEIFGGRRS
jgi:hypothetical protein